MDFHGGYMDTKMYVYYLLRPLLQRPLVRRLLKRPQLPAHKGKFHGYSRSRSELHRLYRMSDFRVVNEQSVCNFKYVATLEPAA